MTWSGRSESLNDSCAQGSIPRAEYMLEILEMVCISYDPTWWSGSYVMNLMWSYVMNLTLVRLLFISHHEVSINISGKMTESSIQSLWQPSASFLLESVVHNNSSTQMVILTINERTVRPLMDVLRGGVRRTGAWSVPASSTTTHRIRASQLDGTRAGTKYNIEHWNHYAIVLIDLKTSASTTQYSATCSK